MKRRRDAGKPGREKETKGTVTGLQATIRSLLEHPNPFQMESSEGIRVLVTTNSECP